ncbi:MAG: molybdenum cofactor guanylyltransferase [Acidimicrobiia bacterium]
MPGASGLLLTGGRSRRFGTDKAALRFEGRTLAARGAALLGDVCDVVVEVGPSHTGLPVAREEPSGAGPLAALAAGREALGRLGATGSTIVLAVDLPRVTHALLTFLRDWPGAPTVVPEVDGRLQPVCARYGPDAFLAAASLVADGASSLHALLDVVEHDVVREDAWGAVAAADTFADVDSPADAARLGIALGE